MKKVKNYFFGGMIMLLNTQAFAQRDLFKEGEAYGFDAGEKFCASVRLLRRGNESEDFFRGCKEGFIKAIESNIGCKNDLINSGRWSEMIDYRNSICS